MYNEQETLSTLLSTGFYPGKKRATWMISTCLLNVLPSINKVDYNYYYLFIIIIIIINIIIINGLSFHLSVNFSCPLHISLKDR